MSFTGDLEHLPIVDIIQLLHAARKSGTLTVHHRKGDNQLVFRDGYIVSANNSRNTVRIGQILREINVLDQGQLEAALKEQQAAGAGRKPLIATLLEKGLVEKEEAFKGLEILIEKTVLEILVWKEGTFTFDVDVVNVSDEYRYFPEKLKREVSFNSQNVLMEALRQYDEKKRDGQLEEEFPEEEPAAAESPSQPAAATASPAGSPEERPADNGPEISADILGLDAVDHLERTIPDTFRTLDDPESSPEERQRERLLEAAPGLPPAEADALVEFLLPYAGRADAEPKASGGTHAVILYSDDRLLVHAATLVCKHDGLLAFGTNDGADLDMIIEQSLARDLTPILILDAPGSAGDTFTREQLDALREEQQGRYPQAVVVQLVPFDREGLALEILAAGAGAVLPRSPAGGTPAAADTIALIKALRAWLLNWTRHRHVWLTGRLQAAFAALKHLDEPRELAFGLLRFVADIFERSLILILGKGEWLSDRHIGFDENATRALQSLRLSLAEDSLTARVAADGGLYFGPVDELLRTRFFPAVGAPREEKVLLLPIASFDKTRFLIYADFGDLAATPVPTELLEILSSQGDLMLENVLCRKRLQKTGGH